MNNRMEFVMAVKQVFETYVYDPGLSSVGQMPFVLMRVNSAHGKACSAMPHDSKKFSRMTQDKCGSGLAGESGA
jgi:hypothetical protein